MSAIIITALPRTAASRQKFKGKVCFHVDFIAAIDFISLLESGRIHTAEDELISLEADTFK